MPKGKKQQALDLINQMIEVSEALDAEKNRQQTDPLSPKGEGWMTFHLRRLEEIINECD